MVIKLMAELRAFNEAPAVYNKLEHAGLTLAMVSKHTNKQEVLVAALLHRVKQELPEHKWKRCQAIIYENDYKAPNPTSDPENENGVHNSEVLESVINIEKLVDSLTKPSKASAYDFATSIISTGTGDQELITLCSIAAEIKLTNSLKVVETYSQLVDRWVNEKLIEANDVLIEQIRQSIESRMSATNESPN